MPHEKNVAALSQSCHQGCTRQRFCLRRSSDQHAYENCNQPSAPSNESCPDRPSSSFSSLLNAEARNRECRRSRRVVGAHSNGEAPPINVRMTLCGGHFGGTVRSTQAPMRSALPRLVRGFRWFAQRMFFHPAHERNFPIRLSKSSNNIRFAIDRTLRARDRLFVLPRTIIHQNGVLRRGRSKIYRCTTI